MKFFLRRFFSFVGVVAIGLSTLLAFGGVQSRAADTIDMTGVPLRFVYSSTDTLTGNSNPNGKSDGDVVVYRNVGTSSGGVSIDAVVTTQLAGATIGDYDNTGSASNSNAIPGTTASHNFQVDMTTSAVNGTTTFTFDFYEAGTWTGANTGTSLILRNVKVTSIDLDTSGSADYQYTDLTGFQKYTTASPTSIAVSSPSTGVVRFMATDDSNGSNRPADRVQVTYDSIGRFTAVFGNVSSGKLGYFGLLFVVDPWNGCGCTTVETANTFNSPPTASNTSRYVTTGVASTITLDDFGNYSDVDGNPFESVKLVALPTAGTLEYYNGSSWATVSINQVVSVVDIALGYLRFTGSTSDSIGFKVFDGLALSTSGYSVTLSVAPNPQTITFANPGTKTSGQTFQSGATASSSLTVVLVSLTPGVCTVSGVSITTVSNGSCSVKSTQPGNTTWSAAQPVTQTFPVSSLLPQTITFTSPGNQTWSGSNITIPSGATASSSLTVALVSFTPSVCTISGLTITVVAQGACRVKATQAGNGTYSPASPVEQTFLISSGGGGQTPTATTQAASSVTDTTATLNGSVNANGSSTTVTFCWGTNAALSGCSSVSATPSTATGSSATAVTYSLSSLAPSTLYYFRVTGVNGSGSASGSILSFSTNASSGSSTTSTTTTTIANSSVCTAPTLSTGTIPNGYVGEPFTWTPLVSSGTFSWTVSSGTLPNGLSLNSSTGTVSGTPLNVQSSTFELSATPTSCSGSVNAGRITVTIVILPPGKVSGIVWIDINKNGKRESKEPLLPGITVTLSSAVSSSSVRSHALTATSAADGSYLIKGVDAGNYTVTAKLSTAVGLTKFWDSKGSADWKVPVTVLSMGEAKADFAAVGNTTMSGTVVSSSSVNPKNAKVSCTWVGIDGKLGTDDDVVYTATTNSVGAYSIPSTPSGKFSCVAEDAVSGKKSTGSVASIAAGSRGTVAVAALKFGVLPETGSSSKLQVWMAFMMLLAGSVVLGTSQRRRTQH